MKEKEFIKKGLLDYQKKYSITEPELNLNIPIYYMLDDEGNVFIDTDSIEEEYEAKIKLLEKITK